LTTLHPEVSDAGRGEGRITEPKTSTSMSEMIYGIHAVQALLERAPERFQEVLF
jgi:tRNA G18 (ribose-2'-O)-methylase SpoU